MDELSPNQAQAIILLKSHFPYRIIWAAIDPSGNELQGADINRRRINKMARQGYQVWIVK